MWQKHDSFEINNFDWLLKTGTELRFNYCSTHRLILLVAQCQRCVSDLPATLITRRRCSLYKMPCLTQLDHCSKPWPHGSLVLVVKVSLWRHIDDNVDADARYDDQGTILLLLCAIMSAWLCKDSYTVDCMIMTSQSGDVIVTSYTWDIISVIRRRRRWLWYDIILSSNITSW